MLYYKSCRACEYFACQKYTRSEIPMDGALRCDGGSLRKKNRTEEINQKGEQT